jgi:ABC-2 type transport system ATP-binding protein
MSDSDPLCSDNVIQVHGLTRRYGAKLALDNVSLTVPRGGVFGLVGANGAGKTTLIKHLLGLLKPQTGSVHLFGRDPVADPVGVLSRIGALSEENDLPGWMRIHELIRYTAAFYPGWDSAYAEQLRQTFALERSARVKHLSKGQRARAGLLLALAHRPELLLLDEPSSGLDPIVRRDILEAIVRTIAEEGRTVLFSSHLLDEVERVSDHIAIIDLGQIVMSGPLDEVKAVHHRLTLRFPEARTQPPALAGVMAWHGEGHEWTAVCSGQFGDLQQAATALGARIVDKEGLSLDEILVAQVGARQPSARKE